MLLGLIVGSPFLMVIDESAVIDDQVAPHELCVVVEVYRDLFYSILNAGSP